MRLSVANLFVTITVLQTLESFAPIEACAHGIQPVKVSNDINSNGSGFQKSSDEIYFYLNTWKNPEVYQHLFTNDTGSVKISFFNASNPTRITLHGWYGLNESDFNNATRDAYLSVGDFNVITVDWESFSCHPRAEAVASLPTAGKIIAEFIDFMVENKFIRLENDLTIIGISLGAHLAGQVGRRTKNGKVHRIFGLDPSSDQVPYSNTSLRLCPSDALYVESIQTNGASFGYKKPLGTATFYPNGGQKQLGCDDDDNLCSHLMAYKLFVDSIYINGLPCIKCPDYEAATKNECGTELSREIKMGISSNVYLARGAYYVPTFYPAFPYVF